MDRPRRSTRPPARLQAAATPPPTFAPAARPKRKTQDAEPFDQLQFLLKNPKSTLTSMDISVRLLPIGLSPTKPFLHVYSGHRVAQWVSSHQDLINAASFNMLSPESQEMLKALLPPTAFLSFKRTIDPDHPSASDSMDVDQLTPSASTSRTLDMTVFTDSHFLAAAHTLQDHIYSDWMSDAHTARVKKYEDGIRDGTLAAAWKDEIWERNNISSTMLRPVISNGQAAPSNHVAESNARAGEAAEIKLVTLAKHGVIRVGDIIAYKRNFSGLDIQIEKDAIIQSIHPKTYALTVLFEPGTTKYLPAHLLTRMPAEPSAPTQSATITSPSMLETGMLDIDGRVERARRPNGNAWKCFTVWRWRGEPGDMEVLGEGGRGGRESHGTLFYLRGTYYHER